MLSISRFSEDKEGILKGLKLQEFLSLINQIKMLMSLK